MNSLIRRTLPLTTGLVLGALLLPGCGGSGGGAGGGSASASKTLTVAIADNVKQPDPALAFDTWATAIVHATTRRLVDYDAEGKLVPDLAEKWDISTDRRTYTFHLRPDARFADGTPIEAEHFVAAIKRVQDPATGSPGADFYAGIRRIEAKDAHTLEVQTRMPEPTLLNVLGMTFAAPYKASADPARPVASGPFSLEEFQSGTRAVLKRNPEDARNSSNLESIVVQMGVEPPLQMTRYTAGEVDLLPGIPLADYQRILQDPAQKDNVAQGVVNQTWYFGMNTTRPPWNNPKVRRAALLAIDRNRQAQLSGAGQAANGILPPHVPGYSADRKLPERNVEEAKKLLAEAGFPNGIPASQKTVMWLASNEQYQRHAQAIQSDLAEAGIPIDLRPVGYSEYLAGYRTNADCWYGGWYPDFPDAGNFLEPVLHGKSIRPGKSPNAARYNNPQVNALLDRAHITPLGAARESMYQQAESMILDDAPWVPLYFEVETRYFRDGVTGVSVHPVWRQMLTGINKG